MVGKLNLPGKLQSRNKSNRQNTEDNAGEFAGQKSRRSRAILRFGTHAAIRGEYAPITHEISVRSTHTKFLRSRHKLRGRHASEFRSRVGRRGIEQGHLHAPRIRLRRKVVVWDLGRCLRNVRTALAVLILAAHHELVDGIGPTFCRGAAHRHPLCVDGGVLPTNGEKIRLANVAVANRLSRGYVAGQGGSIGRTAWNVFKVGYGQISRPAHGTRHRNLCCQRHHSA